MQPTAAPTLKVGECRLGCVDVPGTAGVAVPLRLPHLRLSLIPRPAWLWFWYQPLLLLLDSHTLEYIIVAVIINNLLDFITVAVINDLFYFTVFYVFHTLADSVE